MVGAHVQAGVTMRRDNWQGSWQGREWGKCRGKWQGGSRWRRLEEGAWRETVHGARQPPATPCMTAHGFPPFCQDKIFSRWEEKNLNLYKPYPGYRNTNKNKTRQSATPHISPGGMSPAQSNQLSRLGQNVRPMSCNTLRLFGVCRSFLSKCSFALWSPWAMHLG